MLEPNASQRAAALEGAAARNAGGRELACRVSGLGAHLREHAAGFVSRDLEQFVVLARQQRLCMRVGGGQMWWWASMSSNDASLPVAITTGDALVLNRGK
ncbi:MAG TPA: hypothetical protein VFZ65_02945 [Planctomycetota bacterium]|nr:hypothetical protein [Planctomycetota bacterium]